VREFFGQLVNNFISLLCLMTKLAEFLICSVVETIIVYIWYREAKELKGSNQEDSIRRMILFQGFFERISQE